MVPSLPWHCAPVCIPARQSVLPAAGRGRTQLFPANTKSTVVFPRQSVVAMRTGSKFLHVIARSEATGQSVTLAAGRSGRQCLRQIRKSATNLPKVVPTCQASLRGNGLPQVCALVRNDKLGRLTRTRAGVQCTTSLPEGVQKAVARLRLQGHPPCYCGERSGNPLLLAVQHGRKQCFGRIRKPLRVCLGFCSLFCITAGMRIATPFKRTGSQ